MAMTREQYDSIKSIRQSKATTKSGYRLVLTPHFEKTIDMTSEELSKVDRDNEPIEFDIIDNISITSSSTITSYPIINGDMIAEHMIRQPVSINMSGTYSLYGNKPTAFSGEYDRLTNIEILFERIKDEAVMCDIVTIERGTGTDTRQRFKARSNMVLTSITWTEQQSSINFSFSFTEAMTIDLDGDLAIDYTDENSPAITDAATLDFTDTLLDWSQVDKIVIYQLDSLGLMQQDFWTNVVAWLSNIGKGILSYGVGGTAIGLAAGVGTLITITAVCGSIPVAGWIAAGVIAALSSIAGGIWSLYKTIKRQKAERDYAVQQFKYYNDDKKDEQECIRFTNYISNIHTQLEYLEDVIKVYGISSNEEQECMLYIDDAYYVFTFTKNATQTENNNIVWKCNISDASEDMNIDIANVAGIALSEVTQCTSSNMLFRTIGSGYWVYLINKDLFSVENTTYGSDERCKAIQDCNNNLTSYCILISTINMDNFNEKLKDVVVNAMKR